MLHPKEGVRVRLHGLVGSPQLNGLFGTVLGEAVLDAAGASRWPVRVTRAGQSAVDLKCRETNLAWGQLLAPPPSPAAAPGSLTAPPELQVRTR
jgi:hypothetical protein